MSARDNWQIDKQATQTQNNRVGDAGGTSQTASRTQQGNAEAFMAGSSGSMATQGFNGSQAVGEGFKAGGNMHVTNADNASRYVKQSSGVEQDGADRQGSAFKTVESASMDLQSRVNRS